MTTTSTLPAVDGQTLQQAREIAQRSSSGPPSKRTLMRELKVAHTKATAVLEHLAMESDGRRRSARQALRRLSVEASRKHAVRRLPARFSGVVGMPVSSLVGSAAPIAAPQVTARAAAAESTLVDTVPPAPRRPVRKPAAWPILVLAIPASVAIWAGWVDLGVMAGFGVVHPLPGIVDTFSINTAITLPVGMEAYAAYAARVWMSSAVSGRTRRFARRSSIGSLIVGAAGQIGYHLMVAAGWATAPWPVTAFVACLPVAVFGMALQLNHLVRSEGADE